MDVYLVKRITAMGSTHVQDNKHARDTRRICIHLSGNGHSFTIRKQSQNNEYTDMFKSNPDR